jgi:hypothetical protein
VKRCRQTWPKMVRLSQIRHFISLTCPKNLCVWGWQSSGGGFHCQQHVSDSKKVRARTRNLKAKLHIKIIYICHIYLTCIYLSSPPLPLQTGWSGEDRGRMLTKLTQPRGTEPLRRGGFQSRLRRKEGAATLYPFKGGRGEQDLEPRGADAREARD